MKPKSKFSEAAAKRLEPLTALSSKKKEFDKATGPAIRSVGTRRSYRTCLAQFLNWRHGFLSIELSAPVLVAEVADFLESGKKRLKQKTLDQRAKALQAATRAPFSPCKSQVSPVESRLMPTSTQLRKVIEALPPIYRLAALIAADTGLRVSEIVSLPPPTSCIEPSSHRSWSPDLHADRADVTIFNVPGKGGLVRAIAMHNELFKELNKLLLSTPLLRQNREANYLAYYAFPLPQTISTQFTKTATKVLGFSPKFHSNRSLFLSGSLADLLELSFDLETSIRIISQKAGHFRTGITFSYFRGLSVTDRSALKQKIPDWLTNYKGEYPLTWRGALQMFFAYYRNDGVDTLNSQIQALEALDEAIGPDAFPASAQEDISQFALKLFSHLDTQTSSQYAMGLGQGKIISSILILPQFQKNHPALLLWKAVLQWCSNIEHSQLFTEWLLTIPEGPGSTIIATACHASAHQVSLRTALASAASRQTPSDIEGGDSCVTARAESPGALWGEFELLKPALMSLFHGAGRTDFKIYTERMTKATFLDTVVRHFSVNGNFDVPRIRLENQTAAVIAKRRRERKRNQFPRK